MGVSRDQGLRSRGTRVMPHAPKLGLVRVFSDLNLNGSTPLRAQPRVGEWGPELVPSTRWKKWARVLVPVITVGLAVAVFFLARTFYLILTGSL